MAASQSAATKSRSRRVPAKSAAVAAVPDAPPEQSATPRWPSDPAASVAAKLAYIQGQVSEVAKTGVHQQGYTYMQEHKLIELVKPLLRDVNASVAPGPIESLQIVDKKIGSKEGKMALLTTSVVLRCGDTGGEIVSGTIGFGEDMSDKGAGKAMTYAFKYGLQKLFKIPTDQIDDADATVAGDEGTPAQAPAPAQASGAAPAPAPEAAGQVDQVAAKTLVETMVEFVEKGELDGNKVKAKLATYRTDDVAQLTGEQFNSFREWLNAEVAVHQAKAAQVPPGSS